MGVVWRPSTPRIRGLIQGGAPWSKPKRIELWVFNWVEGSHLLTRTYRTPLQTLSLYNPGVHRWPQEGTWVASTPCTAGAVVGAGVGTGVGTLLCAHTVALQSRRKTFSRLFVSETPTAWARGMVFLTAECSVSSAEKLIQSKNLD